MSRLAVLPDFREEGWISMDYCAEKLLALLPGAERVCPEYRRRATRLSSHKIAVNFDRFYNRFRTYPRFLRRIRDDYSRFHVVDHSYAHLVHDLPAEHTGVYCHDLDAFRSVLEPERVRKPRWFRAMSRKLLTGLQKARIVFHNSQQTRNQLLQYRLIDESRLVHAPLGVAEEYTPPLPGWSPPDWLPREPWILHVGSCVPRKRIDVLLEAFAAARRELPELRLVKVGGQFTSDHRDIIERHGLAAVIVHRPGLARPELADVYRAAPLVVIPSDSEGFGLPAIEALACGAAVLASDIPALREAGGDAALYPPAADVATWATAILSGLRDRAKLPSRELRLSQASRFSWTNHAAIIAAAYGAMT